MTKSNSGGKTSTGAGKSGGGSSRPSATNRSGANGASSRAKQSSQRPAQASSTPAKPQATSKVEFSGNAKKQLGDLGLNAKQRQEAVNWHERTVRREMNHVGADHAKIRCVAHSGGSSDSKPHITASLKDKSGETIKNDHGRLAHIYYDGGRMPPAYKTAAEKR